MAMNKFMGNSRIRNTYRSLAKQQKKLQSQQTANTVANAPYALTSQPTPGVDRGAAYQSMAAGMGQMNMQGAQPTPLKDMYGQKAAQKEAMKQKSLAQTRGAMNKGSAMQEQYRNRSAEQQGQTQAAQAMQPRGTE